MLGLGRSAPYLHDGGVAAGEGAFVAAGGRYAALDRSRLGLSGTLLRGRTADPHASLLALLDRGLRNSLVAANRADPSLRQAHADGRGHAYWVDPRAGFNTEQTEDLIAFLLSLDDQPEVLPAP